MEDKYLVYVDEPYYPSVSFFKTLKEAKVKYEKFKRREFDVILCKIIK